MPLRFMVVIRVFKPGHVSREPAILKS